MLKKIFGFSSLRLYLTLDVLGSVSRVLVAFPDVAAGGGWALPSFPPPVSQPHPHPPPQCVVGHRTKFVAAVCITRLIF